MPRYCESCGNSLAARFCGVCGHDSTKASHAEPTGPSVTIEGDNKGVGRDNFGLIEHVGDNYYPTSADPVASTHSSHSRRLIRVRTANYLVAVLSATGAVAGMLGVTVFEVTLWPFDAAAQGAGSSDREIEIGDFLPSSSWVLVVWVGAFVLLASYVAFRISLRNLKALHVPRTSKILRRVGHEIWLTRPEGACPKCQGLVRLARVVIDRRKVKAQDGTERIEDAYGYRLVCRANPQHQFEFDHTQMI